MPDDLPYTLHYWPIPFRGQFVRAVLAHAGQRWREGGEAGFTGWMAGPARAMAVPFMGPPVLVDRAADVAIAQMPAILLYLGETLALLPDTPALRAATMKVVLDANDVIDDLTLDGGRLMWTPARWRTFVPRLTKWMSLWEETGRRHGLAAASGTLLGEAAPGIADVVTATLWTTMTDRLTALAPMLEAAAPRVAALSRRISALPAQAALAARSRRDYGESYCGGRIEASLRAVLDGSAGGRSGR